MKIIAPRIPETLVPADRRQLEEMYAEEADLTRLRLEKTDLQNILLPDAAFSQCVFTGCRLAGVIPHHRKQLFCHGASPLCPSLCRRGRQGAKGAQKRQAPKGLPQCFALVVLFYRLRYRSTARATRPPSRPLTKNSATPWTPTSSTTKIRGLLAPLEATRPWT